MSKTDAPAPVPEVVEARRRLHRTHTWPTCVAAVAIIAAASGVTPASAAPRADWEWPLAGFGLEQAYVAPAHEYGAGHRGIDLRPLAGTEVRAPASGIVAFVGAVAGRGILTIDHEDGLVTTFEPISSDLAPGAAVSPGDAVGVVAAGGHSATGALHVGVRRDGEYINPLLLLGGVPRAVLLPCCAPIASPGVARPSGTPRLRRAGVRAGTRP